MRVATWNVNCFNPDRAADKLRLLELEAWDVALLQEVNAQTFKTFTDAHGLSGISAAELAGIADEGKAHGVAVLARAPSAVADCELLDIEGASDRERALTMVATVVVEGRETSVVSAHIPNAAGGGIERKMRHYQCLSDWCRSTDGPLVVGMDTNTWSDSLLPLEHDDERFAEEHRFVGLEPAHGLSDVFREHLERNRPDLLDRRRRLGAEGTDGALAVTYVRGGSRPRANRMDRIYASNHFSVRDVVTLYDDALTVGSDHALVIASLEREATGA